MNVCKANIWIPFIKVSFFKNDAMLGTNYEVIYDSQQNSHHHLTWYRINTSIRKVQWVKITV